MWYSPNLISGKEDEAVLCHKLIGVNNVTRNGFSSLKETAEK